MIAQSSAQSKTETAASDCGSPEQALQRLRSRQSMLSSAMRIARLGTWDFEIATGKLEWSDETLAMFGLTRETFSGKLEDFLSALHPEDAPAVLQAQAASLTKDGAIETEYRIRCPNGEERVLWDRGETVFDGNGRPVRRTGVVKDVTEHRLAETKLNKLSAAMEQAPHPILITNREGRIEYVNPAFHNATGYSPLEVLGRTPALLKSGKHPHAFYQKLWKAILSGETFHAEFINRCKDGSEIILDQTIAPLRNRRGEITHFVSSSRDITERKNAERTLRESEERFRQLAETVKEVFWIQDVATNRLLYVSPAFERIWGRPYASMQSPQDWLKTIHPEDRDGVVEYLRDQYREGRHEHTYRIQRPDGEIRWIRNNAYPIIENGVAVRIVGTSDDITDCVVAQHALRHSEERFRLVSRATNDAIWDWNAATDHLWWSEGFEKLFGFQRDQVEYSLESWISRIHPEERDPIVADFEDAIKNGKSVWEAEYRFVRSDGTYAWVRDRAFILRDVSGNATRAIGGMTDITEPKLAQERIAEQAALLNIAREAILVIDLNHKILFWNKGAERTYGWTADEVVGKTTLDIGMTNAATLSEPRKFLFATGEWQGDLPARRKDGRQLVIHARWSLVRHKDGSPKAIFAINSDITETKQLEAQFLRAQRMESIGTLAGGIAHDLNNVLAPILMSVEMLRDQVKDPEDAKYLATIEASARRGAELVHQVLGFARGAEGKRVTLNPSHVAREIQRIVRDTFPKNITFNLYYDRELWSLVSDATQLHQVLMNLCVNARDAMPNGGRIDVNIENVQVDEIFAAVNSEAKPGPYTVITVADTGIGIPRALLERIFEPFFTTKEIGKGTGLGLSTTLSIVRGHGGFIEVSSEPGHGTRFKVYLPASPSAAPSPQTLASANIPRGSGQFVLVIDDEQTLRHITKATLDRHGYHALTAGNGAEAVAIYARDPKITAAIIDMNMPVMDGFATIVALRQFNPALPIIASSGAEDAGVKSLSAGANRFLSKPYTAEDLLRAITSVVSVPTE